MPEWTCENCGTTFDDGGSFGTIECPECGATDASMQIGEGQSTEEMAENVKERLSDG